MVTILKWIAIAVLGLLALMHAALTASLIWHMFRYDVPGAWIAEPELVRQYLIPLASIFGLLILMRYAKPTERKACIAVLAAVTVSFALFLLLHLTGRLTIK
ncbi:MULTISPECIES: hypothetical protein [unclassified Mesorhizobium]|uniref:hypothetical protein n=1 Tax=unclassified Mesorhizobium TaxID=325217 RepID=UPI00333B5A63